jgi:hypothetical protein
MKNAMTGPMMFGLERRNVTGKDSHGFILFGTGVLYSVHL